MAADLRKSYSEDDLPTAPWRFPLSFIPFLVLYVFLSKVRISPKVTIACNGFCLLRHTKIWLARDIISYNGTMFSRVLACTQFENSSYTYCYAHLHKIPIQCVSSFSLNYNVTIMHLSIYSPTTPLMQAHTCAGASYI